MKTIIRYAIGLLSITACIIGIYAIGKSIYNNSTDTVISDKAGITVPDAPYMSGSAFGDSIVYSFKNTWNGIKEGGKIIGSDIKEGSKNIGSDLKEVGINIKEKTDKVVDKNKEKLNTLTK